MASASKDSSITKRDKARRKPWSEDVAPVAKTLLEHAQKVSSSSKRNSLHRRQSREGIVEKENVGALHIPSEDSKETIQLLLGKGYSISYKTLSGDSALHVACISGNLEAVDALLNFSDQLSIRECLRHENKEGNSPLHLALKSGNRKITPSLLEHFMPVDFKHIVSKPNRLGETCLGLAIKIEDWKLAMILLKHSCSNPATLCHDFVQNFPECGLIEKLQVFVHEPTNVFVLGDAKSSKTTLISTLQYSAQSTLSKIWTAIPFLGNQEASESCKCCVVPLTVEYRKPDHKCPFVFHDVSGHHSYAQEAIFACCRNPLEALYIITVDVRINVEDSIAYWLCFLNHQLVMYRNCVGKSPIKTSKMKVRVAIALTFCDLVPSSRLQQVSKMDFTSLPMSSNADLNVSSQFEWCGNFSLNARKHNSLGMPQLISILHSHCSFSSLQDSTDESQNLLAQTYLLAALLRKEHAHADVTTFNDTIGLVQHSNNQLCKMLPKEDSEIEKLCLNLDLLNPFKVLSFDNQSRKSTNWYIALDYKYLLKSVEKALVDLAWYSKNGIVTRQQIKDVFIYPPDFIIRFLEHLKICEYVSCEGLESMKRSIRSSKRSKHSNRGSTLNISIPTIVLHGERKHRRTKSESDTLDSDDIIASRQLSAASALRSNSNIATHSLVKPEHLVVDGSGIHKQPSKPPSPVSSQHSSKRSVRSTASNREVPHYFFPSLIPTSQPEDLWEEDLSDYCYGFSWSLVPRAGDKWFLSPKFITIVLFRLLFSFAPTPPNPKSFVDRLCKLRNRGILWSDPQGARVCVAISDENKVTLSMQCLRKYEVSCLSIRNEIMADIKQKLAEIHPNIHPQELFTPLDGISVFPIVDPLKSYATFDKKEILLSIMENRPVMCTQGKNLKPLDSLLHFEPLCYLYPSLLRDLFDEKKKCVQISDDFCMQFAMNLSSKWTCLADHFLGTVIKKYYIDSLTDDGTLKKAPHNTAMEMLTYLKELDHHKVDDDYRVDTYGGLQRSLFEISIFTPNEVVTEWQQAINDFHGLTV